MRLYSPQSKKLDPKTIIEYFIGYHMGSRGSRFYYPSHTTRVIESDCELSILRMILVQAKGQEKLCSRNIQFLFLCLLLSLRSIALLFTSIQSPLLKMNQFRKLTYKLQKSIYSLKQASKQWYLNFDEVVTANGFKENIVNQCIYMKVSGSK